MPKVKSQSIEFSEQVGALPWRIARDGSIEVLLVTSRISKHWLIPKGWPIAGRTAAGSALQEAFEEAGIIAKVTRRPLGDYRYVKILKDGTGIPCVVRVFGLDIEEELDDWPEREQRERRWFPLRDAAAAVNERGLAEFLQEVEPQLKVLAHPEF